MILRKFNRIPKDESGMPTITLISILQRSIPLFLIEKTLKTNKSIVPEQKGIAIK